MRVCDGFEYMYMYTYIYDLFNKEDDNKSGIS